MPGGPNSFRYAAIPRQVKDMAQELEVGPALSLQLLRHWQGSFSSVLVRLRSPWGAVMPESVS